MSDNNSKQSGFTIGQINNNNGQVNLVNGNMNQVYNVAGKTNISIDDFVRILQQVEEIIAKSTIDQQTQIKIKGNLEATITEGTSDRPHKSSIIDKIERTLNIVNSLGGAVTATQVILPLLKQALDWAHHLY